MLTRAQIESEFEVKNGIIRDPGKFEGEPSWVVAFWEEVLDGSGENIPECCLSEALSVSDSTCGDECECTLVSVFSLTEDDWRGWPELAGKRVVAIWETDQGFVIGRAE